MNIFDNKSFKSFLIPSFILIIVYLIHYLFFVPFWPFDPDTLEKLNFVKENLILDTNNHQHMRWGSYFIYKLSSYFINVNFITITTTSLIIFLLSSLIFSYCVHIHLGLAYSSLFVIFWITNKAINIEIFSFSVVNQTLLALSILFFLLQKSENLNTNFFNSILIGLILFWLYGIKETNIFFYPLLFFYKIFRENLIFVIKIIFICVIFYFIETIVINSLSEQNFIFGRISALLAEGGRHSNAMQEFSYEGIDSFFEKSMLIFYRWYSARDWDTTIFYFSFFLSIFFLFNNENNNIIKNNFSNLISLLIISFFLCNTFFIISLFPPTMGQPLNTRFLTILLPFSFISIIMFIKIIITKSSHRFFSFLLILLVLFTFFSRPIYSLFTIDENWGYLSLASHKGNNAWDRYEQFSKFNQNLHKYDCIIIKSKNPHVIAVLGEMPIFLNKTINKSDWIYDYKNNILKKKNNISCNYKIIIKENEIIYN